jgi:hypothetical protein
MATTSRSAIDRTGLLSKNPLSSQASEKKKAPNAPNMKTSPCAKLIIRRIP